jgi:glycosyltransferase involved in cell wall biosynthesis
MAQKPRVLFVCHNHPDLHPGGTEIFSHGLFHAMKSKHGLEAVYLACVNKVHRGRLPGTLLQSAGPAPDEILLWAGHFDRFTLSQIDLHGIVPEFERLLLAFRPDIVHFHHVLLMGVEALQVVRRVLPEAGIVLTLHDYYPICSNDGQMVTTRERKLCRSASADSCSSCFPETQRDQFVMRELFIKQNLSLVDRFISPSSFLKRRYVEWGLPEDRIDVIRNGIRDAAPAPHGPLPPSGRRDRFAFFGHLNPYKGALVAIEAAKLLAQRSGAGLSLTLHGSADFQTDEFRAELAKASEGASFIVARGRYSRDEVAALMAEADWVIVPSIWWENAPLIIQEAFQHRRPVICSSIGGMAEAVRDRVDGLWFNVSDPRHLADKMEEALDPELWAQLVAGVRTPRRISEAADEHLALYRKISASRRGVEVEEGAALISDEVAVEPAAREPLMTADPADFVRTMAPVATAVSAREIEPTMPTVAAGVPNIHEKVPDTTAVGSASNAKHANPDASIGEDMLESQQVLSAAFIAACTPNPRPPELDAPAPMPVSAPVPIAPVLPAAVASPDTERKKPVIPAASAASGTGDETPVRSGHRLRRLLRGDAA